MTKKQPTRNFSEYFWCLKNVQEYYPDICIDVGAGYGTPAIYQSFPNSKHVCIEPLKDHLPQLRKNLKDIEHEIFNVGVLDKPGEQTIRKPDADNLLTASLAAKTAEAKGTATETIKISTVDDVMSSIDWTGSILLKTDCQGTDYQALQGAKKTLERCDVVIVETPLFRFWGDHQADFYDIVNLMKQNGFVVHDLLDGLFRPLDRALGQIDVAFVKENGPFRKKRFWG